ncbi:IclR family transcriptional regulator [Streptomyces sp. BI20]|uniref:IclR family transcriptional regulator n=1 Tax=Streptomyces sp. BI20 TaxID=3403460 RepID=UPI003C76D975
MSQSVERALAVLPVLAEGPAGLGAVADALDVHKSTALRLLRTLAEHGYAHRLPDGRYRLGARLFTLAAAALENLDVREIARPHLLALGAETGHTVHLALRQDDEVVYVDKVEARSPVRMWSRIGRPVPVTVAAVAKVLFADLPEAERVALAHRLEYPAYTARSTPDAESWLRELAEVRDRGWACDLGGHEEAVHCVGAPVRGGDGRVLAAVSVSAPAALVPGDRLLDLLPSVRRTADLIGRDHSGTAPVDHPESLEDTP